MKNIIPKTRIEKCEYGASCTAVDIRLCGDWAIDYHKCIVTEQPQ